MVVVVTTEGYDSALKALLAALLSLGISTAFAAILS